jgi:C1A family cysteine protease
MKALRLFGTPPAETWPYNVSSYEIEPTSYVYAYAQNYKALQYARFDSNGAAPQDVLQLVKASIYEKYPVMFGFNVFSSLDGSADIPYPGPKDSSVGGHAVLIVGFDDARQNRRGGGGDPENWTDDAWLDSGGAAHPRNRGAFLIRNSWGTEWGDAGYGWLPYAYLMDGLADDFWTAFSQDWVPDLDFS